MMKVRKDLASLLLAVALISTVTFVEAKDIFNLKSMAKT